MSLTTPKLKKASRDTYFVRERLFCEFCTHGGHKKAYRSYWALLMHSARDHKDQPYRAAIEKQITLLHTHGGFTHAPADSANIPEGI